MIKKGIEKSKKFLKNERTMEILEVVGKLGFILFLGIAAPNAAGHIIKMLGWIPDYRNKYSTRKALESLERQKFIQCKKSHNERMLKVTAEGKLYLARLKVRSIKLPVKSRWDNLWRMITFDIPEESKINRRRFVTALHVVGMFNLEKSIYLYPHECRKQIFEIADLYLVSKYIRYVVANFVDRDKRAKRFFNIN